MGEENKSELAKYRERERERERVNNNEKGRWVVQLFKTDRQQLKMSKQRKDYCICMYVNVKCNMYSGVWLAGFAEVKVKVGNLESVKKEGQRPQKKRKEKKRKTKKDRKKKRTEQNRTEHLGIGQCRRRTLHICFNHVQEKRERKRK